MQSKNQTALLLLNGECPPPALMQALWGKASFHLFADGATPKNPAAFKPSLILGDLDSYNPKTADLKITAIKKVFDQQKTDAEKCLEYLQEQAYTHVHVLGADGKRLDHSLYNLKLLCQFAPQFKQLTFYNAFEQIFATQHSLKLEGFVGQRISFFPSFGATPPATLPAATQISTRGLAYNLTADTLSYHGLCSISNQLSQPTAHIEVQAGWVIVFLEHQLCL